MTLAAVTPLALLAACGDDAPVSKAPTAAAALARAAMPVGPHSTAAEILARRDRAPAREVRLDAATRTRVGGDAEGGGGSRSNAFQLGLGPDYYRVSDGDLLTVHDFRLRRIFAIDLARRGFTNHALYATVGRRALALSNRRVLHEAGAAGRLLQVHAAPVVADPFWREADLGAVDARAPGPVPAMETDADGVLRVLYDGEDVASLQFAETPVDAATAGMLARYLRYAHRLHPAVVDLIEAGDRLPAEIRYRHFDGKEAAETVLTLAPAEDVEADFPLTEDLEPLAAFGMADAFSRDAAAVTVPAVRGEAEARPPRRQDFVDRMNRQLKGNALLDATLTGFELLLYRPDWVATCGGAEAREAGAEGESEDGGDGGEAEICGLLRAVSDAVRQDATARRQFAALSPALNRKRSGIEHAEAAERLRRFPKDDLDSKYLLEFFLANERGALALSHADRVRKSVLEGQALEGYLTALRANPYAAGFYKSLGDFFYYRLEMPAAWTYWDLGRALPNRATEDDLSSVARIEAKLRESFPGYF